MRLSLLLLPLLGASRLVAAEDPAAIVARLAPAAGWSAPEAARTATHDTLFDLIDGGAELYHEYGFVRAVSWQLETAAKQSIQVELYEMTDAPAAFGVWSLMQTGSYTRGTLGQGSLRFGYYVAFWSGRYFASVTGAQPDTATQGEVDRLAAALAELLPRDGVLPAWFTKAPREGRVASKYFRGRIGLSNITVGDAIELFDAPEGLVAEYPGGQLVLLPSSDRETARMRCGAALERLKLRPAGNRIRATTDSFTFPAEGDDVTQVCFDSGAIYILSGTDHELRSRIRLQADAAR